MPNKEAEKLLREKALSSNAKHLVDILIEGGFIESIPQSESERLAECAKRWLGRYCSSADIFDKASGWTPEAWKVVTKESGEDWGFDTPMDRKHIFTALVILAKEAGVEL